VYLHSKGIGHNQINPLHIHHVNPGHTSAIKIMDFDAMGADKPLADLESFLGENKRDSAVYVAHQE
jgi:hypothetical protein